MRWVFLIYFIPAVYSYVSEHWLHPCLVDKGSKHRDECPGSHSEWAVSLIQLSRHPFLWWAPQPRAAPQPALCSHCCRGSFPSPLTSRKPRAASLCERVPLGAESSAAIGVLNGDVCRWGLPEPASFGASGCLFLPLRSLWYFRLGSQHKVIFPPLPLIHNDKLNTWLKCSLVDCLLPPAPLFIYFSADDTSWQESLLCRRAQKLGRKKNNTTACWITNSFTVNECFTLFPSHWGCCAVGLRAVQKLSELSTRHRLS